MAQEQQLQVYTTTWCGDCRRSKRWLRDNNIPFTEINIGEDEHAAEYVRKLNGGSQSVPTIVFPDGTVMAEPSNRALALQVAKILHIDTPDAKR